jgi:predicted Zn-dependent peptidase
MEDITSAVAAPTLGHASKPSRPTVRPLKRGKDSGQWFRSKTLHDRYWVKTLSSGLRLVVIPREGFAAKAAMLTFNVGSINTAWLDSGGHAHRVPAGSAHFLEHQLFKKAKGDLSAAFDRTGASTNAYTTQYNTSFHFEGVSNFETNLDTLVELGITPYFDPNLVEIERGIIEQELARYEDRADTRAWNTLMYCLYHRHPVREDILGSMESLSKISPESLGRIHAAYYHPANASLFAAGDLEPHAVEDIAEAALEAHFDGRKWHKPVKPEWKEPARIVQPREVLKFHSTHDWLMMGWKLKPTGLKGLASLREDEAAGAALTLAFGAGTDFLEQAVRDGLVIDNLGSGYLSMEDCGYCMVGGETPDAARMEAAIRARIKEVSAKGFDAAELELHKRKSYGVSLRKAEMPEAAVSMHEEAWLAEVEPFEASGLVLELTTDDLMDMWRRMMRDDHHAVVVVKPVARRGRSKHQ